MALTEFTKKNSPFGNITMKELMEVEKLSNFRDMYTQNFAPLPLQERRDGRYKLSDAEHWLLQAYAIQHMNLEQDEFNIALVYPENIPVRYMLESGIVPMYERDLDAMFVWEIYTDNGTVGNIKTTVGMWDNRNRIRTLWHEDEEDSVDPADVLSDGPDKWVHVSETKGRDGRDYKSVRSKRMNYRSAGGPELDKRQQKLRGYVGHGNPFEDTIDERGEWREHRMAHYDLDYSFDGRSRPSYERPNVRESSVYKRESMDRAHADEMMGPAEGE